MVTAATAVPAHSWGSKELVSTGSTPREGIMSSIWIGLVALLGGWVFVAVALGALIARWMHMQRR